MEQDKLGGGTGYMLHGAWDMGFLISLYREFFENYFFIFKFPKTAEDTEDKTIFLKKSISYQ